MRKRRDRKSALEGEKKHKEGDERLFDVFVVANTMRRVAATRALQQVAICSAAAKAGNTEPSVIKVKGDIEFLRLL